MLSISQDRPVKKWPSSPFKNMNPRKLAIVIILEGGWIKAGCPGISKFEASEVTTFLYQLRNGKPISANMSGLWTAVHISWYNYIKRHGQDAFQLLCYLTEIPRTKRELYPSTSWRYDQLDKRLRRLIDKLEERKLGHLVVIDDLRKPFKYSLNPSLFS